LMIIVTRFFNVNLVRFMFIGAWLRLYYLLVHACNFICAVVLIRS
jgi:hypothetical protein